MKSKQWYKRFYDYYYDDKAIENWIGQERAIKMEYGPQR